MAQGRDALSGPTDLPGSPAGESSGWAYRPHLDGLRTVAVYLVVLFHSGVQLFSGGYIGVDVFFVLSGYLVTQVLVQDVRQHGSVDLKRFYSRRFRRLLPAAAVVLVVTAVVYRWVAPPAAVADAFRPMSASALYYVNWVFVADASDYFAVAVDQSPVLHFWSLAVEEQFYFVWPLAFAGLHMVTRRVGAKRWAVMRAVVGVGIVASAVAALWIGRTDLSRAYFGTDTRAYQLLAGVFPALSPGIIRSVRRLPGADRLLGVASGLGLIWLTLAATRWLTVSEIERGVIATALTVMLLVVLEGGGAGIVKRGLSLAPMVYLGRISYGIYLWHWIVIIVLVNESDLSAVAVASVTIALATGLASLSYQILELPLRQWRRAELRYTKVIGLGLTVSLVMGVAVLPRLLTEPPRGVGVVSGSEPVSSNGLATDVDWQFARGDAVKFSDCAADGPAGCILVRGQGPTVLLLGDSHALALSPMVRQLAEDRSLTVAVATSPGCPWAVGLLDLDPRARACEARRAKWYSEIVPVLDPELVILAQRPVTDPSNPIALSDEKLGPLEIGTTKTTEAIVQRSRETIKPLVDSGRNVLILESIPVAPKGTNPITCLSEATFTDECRFVVDAEPHAAEQAYRRLAREVPGVWSADLDRLVCPYLPICDPLAGEVVVFRDDIHVSATFARSLSDAFGEYLDDNGLLTT